VSVSRHTRASFPAHAASAAAARRFVRHALADWQAADATADVALLTCEIVTNALVHAGTDIEVACRVQDGGVRVEVSDGSRHRLIPPSDPRAADGADQESGRGLLIVDQLADSWGVSYAAQTKSVWFSYALPAAGGPVEVPPGAVAGGDDSGEVRRPIAGILGNASLTGSFLDRALELVRASTGADTACILRADEDPAWLIVVPAAGRLREPQVTRVAASGPFDLAQAPGVYGELNPDRDHLPAIWDYPCRSLATVPIAANGQVIGLLAVGARESGRFGQHTTLALRQAADEVAVAVERFWLAEGAGTHEGSAAFLARASCLLAGRTDPEDIAVLTAMLVVPRIADWCAVYLAGESGSAQLAHVWHKDERLLGPLRAELERQPAPARSRSGRDEYLGGGQHAVQFPLVYGTRWLGTLLVGRDRVAAEPGVAGLLDDLRHRVAFALDLCRGYRREAATSRILQQALVPAAIGAIAGIESSVIYEPVVADCAVGGDFYDLFQAGQDRWCLVLGDVCGNGPEAAVTTGLARNAVRLLARDGYGATAILDRLNRVVIDEDAPDRFLSMLCGEVVPLRGGGARVTLASAGHPLPWLLRASGEAEQVGEPQLLLGIVPEPGYRAGVTELAAGDALICVTDGVTERTDGTRQLDDDNGLARLMTGWAGLPATVIAERIHAAVQEFADDPPHDDIAVLVLAAERR
jgi:anti-sigma regulatory factor (Ser/Thr protein kinase)